VFVYRVEDSERWGPYHQGGSGDVYEHLIRTMKHGEQPHTPSSYGDIPAYNPFIEGKWRHGFLSIEMLMRWFNDCEAVLDRNGFKITRYEVPRERVLIGGHQLVFDAEYAREV
jgi:hypothetical protein